MFNVKNDSKVKKGVHMSKLANRTEKKDRDIDKTVHSILSNTQSKIGREEED